MDKKEIKLIKKAIGKNPITASELAAFLDVTTRTIKKYIRDLNILCPGLFVSTNKGYSIKTDLAVELLKDPVEEQNSFSEERVSSIIKQLLKYDQESSLDLYELADSMYISESTLKSDLRKVSQKLNEFELGLEKKNDRIRIIGPEKNKRKLLSSLLYDESNTYFIDNGFLQLSFPDVDILEINKIVTETFDDHQIYINDYALMNLVLHISIAVQRIKNGYRFQNINNHSLDLSNDLSTILADEIVKKIENTFKIDIDYAEQYEIQLLLNSSMTIDSAELSKEYIHLYIGDKCYSLVNEILEEVCESFGFGSIPDDFFIRFSLHIYNLLNRANNNLLFRNPLTESVKTKAPLLYDAGVYIVSLIKEKTHIEINDDEIAYIALHLSVIVNEINSHSKKIGTVLYSPNYYNMNQTVVSFLRRRFGDELSIKNVYTKEEDIEDNENVMLIICTVPMRKTYATRTILINPIPSPLDENAIDTAIRQIAISRKKKAFENDLRSLLQYELFEKNNKIKNEIECITYLAMKLEKLGYVDKEFRSQVLEREKLSSTAFGNVAIPHSMKMNANKTSLTVYISDKPILWGNGKVNLVIMMCFSTSERYIFNKIYEQLVMLLTDASTEKRLANCETYEDFIQTIVSAISF